MANVQRAASKLGLTFPIAVDNDFAIWKSFSNQYWPSLYLVDAQGRIRYHHFGEGEYERSEQVIRQLLDEARASTAGGKTASGALLATVASSSATDGPAARSPGAGA